MHAFFYIVGGRSISRDGCPWSGSHRESSISAMWVIASFALFHAGETIARSVDHLVLVLAGPIPLKPLLSDLGYVSAGNRRGSLVDYGSALCIDACMHVGFSWGRSWDQSKAWWNDSIGWVVDWFHFPHRSRQYAQCGSRDGAVSLCGWDHCAST